MRKAIFVDHASLLFMAETLGCDRVNYRMLYKFLTTKVGKLTDVSYVVSTLSPFADEQFKKLLARAGFEVILIESGEGKDDQALIDRIKLLHAEKVGELVVVTSDSDFVPVLSLKAREGMYIHLVATKTPDPGDGHIALGADLRDRLERNEYLFTDVADFKDMIFFKSEGLRRKEKRKAAKATPPAAPKPGPAHALQPIPPPAPAPAPPPQMPATVPAPAPAVAAQNGHGRRVKVIIEVDGDEHDEAFLMTSIRVMKQQCPALRYQIEG